jgi:hypothetical protein
MSLPIAAGGPLNVLMKPILIVYSWAPAGPATSASTVAAATPVLIICVSSLRLARSEGARLSAIFLSFLSTTESADFDLGRSS